MTQQPFLFASQSRGRPGRDGANVLPTDQAIEEKFDLDAADPGTVIGAKLSAAYDRVLMLPAASGVAATDTTALQAILDTVDPADGNTLVRGRKGATYKLASPGLTLKSGTTLDMTGCIVQLPSPGAGASAETRMVQNEALLGVGARDIDIHIVGGRWERTDGAAVDGKERHLIVMHRVDGCSVTDATFDSSSNKYCVLFADVTDYRAERLHFDSTNSDGVHVDGPATNGTIRDLTGSTGDDFVAFTARTYDDDGYAFTAGGGDIIGALVENVHREGGLGGIVKVLAGQGTVVDHITIDGVHGSTTQRPVTIFDDTEDPATMGGRIGTVTIRNVTAYATNNQAQVHCNMSNVGTLDIEGVEQTQAGQLACVDIDATAVVGHVRVARLRGLRDADATQYLINVRAGAEVGTLDVEDVVGRIATAGRLIYVAGDVDIVRARLLANLAESAGYFLQLVSGGTTRVVEVSQVDAVLKTDLSAGRVAQVDRAVTGHLRLEAVSQAGGQATVNLDANSVAPVVELTSVRSTSSFLVRHNAPNAVEVRMIRSGGTSSGMVHALGSTGCAATIRCHQPQGSAAVVTRSGTQTCRVIGGPEARVDGSILNPTDGDMFTNTGNSAGGGWYLGPVVFTSSPVGKYVPLRGFVATGTATLVAGTVTVADTKVTGNTRLRLEVETPGGTLGALHYTRTAGASFTINSTSNTDTSVVRYWVIYY